LLRFRSTTTPHFNFKCFVITKTSFRRSFGEKLYISSFGSLRTLTSSASSSQRLLSGGHLAEKLYINSFGPSLALTTSSRKDICNRASFIWTGFAIATFHLEVKTQQDLLVKAQLFFRSSISSVCFVRLSDICPSREISFRRFNFNCDLTNRVSHGDLLSKIQLVFWSSFSTVTFHMYSSVPKIGFIRTFRNNVLFSQSIRPCLFL
jgi:hypothetical protein